MQNDLAKQQDALGELQESVRISVPINLDAQLKKVEEEIRALGPTASQDDLGRIQTDLGSLQSSLGELQSKAGEQQGELGRQQSELGRQQADLGRQEADLSRGQDQARQAAFAKMQEIVKQAIANGLAQPMTN
jgi:peptidoglycan hydrolase CwlO-like protein